MNRFILAMASAAIVINVSAPVPASAQNKDLWGMILGGAGGGWLGSKFGSGSGQLAATAAGTLLGAVLGRNVGQSLNIADQAYNRGSGQIFTTRGVSQPRYQQRYEPRRYEPWQYEPRQYEPRPYWQSNIYDPNPPRSQYARIQRPLPFRSACLSGLVREYQTVITVGGREVPAWGRACFMGNGSWRPIGSLAY